MVVLKQGGLVEAGTGSEERAFGAVRYGGKWRVWGKGKVGAIMLYCLALGSPEARAQHGEYAVKAAFLYNFAKFAEWPEVSFAAEDRSFVVGVVGEDPFGGVLDGMLADKMLKGREVKVVHFAEPVEALRTCHILFVGKVAKGRLKEVKARIDGAPVLTVGEMDGFIAAGGMINFVLVEGRVRFAIDGEKAKKVGLKVSAKLLRLSL